MALNHIQIITNLISAHEEGKLAEYNTKQLDSFPIKDKIIAFSAIIKHCSAVPGMGANNKNFKMEYFYKLIEFIVNKIVEIYSETNVTDVTINQIDDFLVAILLEKITRLFKGQHLLNKLAFRINKKLKNENQIIPYLLTASEAGTFITFLFWLNYTKGKNLESIAPDTLEKIYINSIGNSDDRLYKYILNHINKHDKLFFQKNNNVINSLISTLSNSTVPSKYQLRRIKVLSQQISLIPYFRIMINSFTSEKVLLELHKYYYVDKYYYVEPYGLETLCKLIKNFILLNNTGFDGNCLKILKLMDILQSKEEKTMCQIITSFITNFNFNFKVIDNLIFDKIIIDYYEPLIRLIDWNDFINSLDHVEINKKALKTMVTNNLVTKYCIKFKINYKNMINDWHGRKLFFFTRFFDTSVNYVVNINLLLHKLRLIAKKRNKTRIVERQVKMFELLKEIKTFSPIKTIPVLSNGSYGFQQQQQKFTNLPPRHLLPGELSIYNNFFLKEKADGILINNLPIGIYPQSSIISNYQVKAEYIEELDLYLVFDIDIPNTTIIDRYNLLRQAHSYTYNTCLEQIDDLNDMFKIMDKERSIIKQFIRENSEQPIKWYPKFACVVSDNCENIYKQLINLIIEEQDELINSKLKLSEPFNCDGLILTPLDGKREIKIKPKSMMTIDLLYNGGKWIDRNNYDWSHLIIKPKAPKKEGRIYRCYPSNDKFIVGEYRYDKKQPNPYIIVDNVVNMVNYEWTNDLKDQQTFYYEEKKSLKSVKLIQMIKAQNELLEKRIEMIEPSLNKNWLDLGCGRGKLIPIIKKYNPKAYLGLDADIKQLVSALKYHDENQNIYQFNPCDLSSNWIFTKNKWHSFNNKIKYDYVIANFSLMHFCTEDFWTQLEELVHEETKFIFNLVKPNCDNEWSESESFLKVEDGVVKYRFEWTHQQTKTEKLIRDELINNYLEKFNWKVIDKKPVNSDHQLLTLYDWWIVQKSN